MPGRSPPDRLTVMARNCWPRSLVGSGASTEMLAMPSAALICGTVVAT